MQALYTIQEVAIFMFQICGFLMGLLVIWVLVMAGAELYRYRKCQMDKTRGERSGGDGMDKKDLIPGKTYLRKHKVTVHGRYGNKEAEAEGYIECMQVTPAGAVFFQSGNVLKLKDEEIEREVREG